MKIRYLIFAVFFIVVACQLNLKCQTHTTEKTPSGKSDSPQVFLWKFKAKYEIHSSILQKDGIIYFGDTKNLYALNALNGKEAWSIKVSSEVFYLLLCNDSVLCYTSDSSIMGISLLNHRQLWSFHVNGQIGFEPKIYKEKIYFGAINHCFYCLDPISGKEIKKLQLDGEVSDDPIISKNGVNFIEDYQLFVTLDKSGDIQRKLHVSDDAGCVNNYGDTLYYIDRNHKLEAWTITSWKNIWNVTILDSTTELPDSVTELPLVENGIGYIAAKSDILAISIDNGKIKWNSNCHCDDPHNFIKVGQHLFFSSKNRFYSIDLEGKNRKLQFSASNLILPFPLVYNQTLYFATDNDSSLYAIKYK